MGTVKRLQHRAIVGRRILFAACILAMSGFAVNCGGKTDNRANHDESGAENAGAGGADVGSAAAGSAGAVGSYPGGEGPILDDDFWSFNGSAGAGGESAQPSSGASGSGGDAGTVDDCPVGDLWMDVGREVVGGLGSCGPWLCNERASGLVPEPWGALVVDGDGALVDVIVYTGRWEQPKEAWLAEHEGELWPCLLDQTVNYCCTVAP